jgi:hypothetical protein
MSDNVVDLNVVTSLDIDPERILRKALGADLKAVVIVGELADGSPFFASSASDGGTALWYLERGKHQLIQIGLGS